MGEFRLFLEQQKLWSAKKDDIVSMWQTLPNLPLAPRPIPLTHRGPRFGEDGLRISGTPAFINSVLTRIKDFIGLDRNPGVELDVQYRQIPPSKDEPNLAQFVCYVYLAQKEIK